MILLDSCLPRVCRACFALWARARPRGSSYSPTATGRCAQTDGSGSSAAPASWWPAASLPRLQAGHDGDSSWICRGSPRALSGCSDRGSSSRADMQLSPQCKSRCAAVHEPVGAPRLRLAPSRLRNWPFCWPIPMAAEYRNRGIAGGLDKYAASPQNWQGRAAPGLEGSIPPPRRPENQLFRQPAISPIGEGTTALNFPNVSPICPENGVVLDRCFAPRDTSSGSSASAGRRGMRSTSSSARHALATPTSELSA